MKRQIKLVILLALVGLVMAAPATAGEWIFGAKTGTVVVDNSNVKTHPTNVGIMVGFQQSLVLGELGIEAEITKSTNKGKYDDNSRFEVNTHAIYGAFRTAGPFYFKAKAGYLTIDDNNGITESGASYGIGLGFGIGIAQLELELTNTTIDAANASDISFVSLGVQF